MRLPASLRLVSAVVAVVIPYSMASSAIAQRAIAIEHVNVIPMDRERVLPNQTVVVKGDRIYAIGTPTDVKVPRYARIIDGRNEFLIPGLVDSHAHIGEPEETLDFTPWLEYGITTLRSMGDPPSLLQFRDSVRAGRILAPDLIVCKRLNHLHSALQATAAVREAESDHYDCIKIYDDLSGDAYRAAIVTAHELNLRAVGHIPRGLPWGEVRAGGQDSVDHAEEFLYAYFNRQQNRRDESTIAPLVEEIKGMGMTVTPTLVTYDYIGRQVGNEIDELLRRPEMGFYSPATREQWGRTKNHYRRDFASTPDAYQKLRANLAFLKKFVTALHARNVPLLAGTDATGVEFVFPGSSLYEELQLLHGCGLSNFETLRTATMNPAEFMQLSDEVGSVSIGKRADLVLLKANPLQDLTALRSVSVVFVRGTPLSADSLSRMKKKLESKMSAQ